MKLNSFTFRDTQVSLKFTNQPDVMKTDKKQRYEMMFIRMQPQIVGVTIVVEH